MRPAFRLGFVEGFYGKPWSWSERADTAEFMASHGFKLYLYAPKGDAFLRRRWREPWPKETAQALAAVARHFRARGLEFGVGLSPLELRQENASAAERLVLRKLDELASLGATHLALLFDDMKGDDPRLARRQIAAAHAIRKRWPEGRLSLCPTYYSLDPLLDRLFGPRPADYLAELGRALDPEVEIFWTGEKICSSSYTVEHLREVASVLRRPPLLWDNYPVNDTETMSRFLRLKPCTGRPAALRAALSGHLLNPMLQPVLSRVPALTLVESYARGDGYDAPASFAAATREVLGEKLASLIARDLEAFAAQGLSQLQPQTIEALRLEYAGLDHAGAREVVRWLNGSDRVTKELIARQQ